MNDRVTLLLEGKSSSSDWEVISEERNIVRVPAFSMLETAIDTAIHELGLEVTSVILDRSATAAQCLELLCALPPEFRGDVLAINDDRAGFLSAVTPSDGRVLYRLTSKDIEFYRSVRFSGLPRDSAYESLETAVCN